MSSLCWTVRGLGIYAFWSRLLNVFVFEPPPIDSIHTHIPLQEWHGRLNFIKVRAGFREHVIPALDYARAWDLCFLKSSFKCLCFWTASHRFHSHPHISAGMTWEASYNNKPSWALTQGAEFYCRRKSPNVFLPFILSIQKIISRNMQKILYFCASITEPCVYEKQLQGI